MGAHVLAVALGGALGSVVRHGVNVAVARATPLAVVPYATFLVNAAGCAVVGVLAGLIAAGRLHVGESTRVFLFVGVLGGFTTFSTFALDTLTLARSGAWDAAAWNAVGQVVVGFAAAAVGFWLAHGRA